MAITLSTNEIRRFFFVPITGRQARPENLAWGCPTGPA
jgi:hypothetical protein